MRKSESSAAAAFMTWTDGGSSSRQVEDPVRGSLSEKSCSASCTTARWPFYPGTAMAIILNPSEVNYRANLYAMKMLKVEYLFSITAVGSLQEELKPGELVIPDQYFDMTFKREKTFFENGVVAHVPLADPTCRSLGQLAFRLARESGLIAHLGGTYCNMEGPQFSSRAESLAYRQMGFSLIGMTQAVEAKLARELEMCFLPLALVTDYDCWHQSGESVTVEMVIANLNKAVAGVKKLLPLIIGAIPEKRELCPCASALATSIITAPAMIPEKTYKKLEIIIGKYIKSRL